MDVLNLLDLKLPKICSFLIHIEDFRWKYSSWRWINITCFPNSELSWTPKGGGDSSYHVWTNMSRVHSISNGELLDLDVWGFTDWICLLLPFMNVYVEVGWFCHIGKKLHHNERELLYTRILLMSYTKAFWTYMSEVVSCHIFWHQN